MARYSWLWALGSQGHVDSLGGESMRCEAGMSQVVPQQSAFSEGFHEGVVKRLHCPTDSIDRFDLVGVFHVL